MCSMTAEQTPLKTTPLTQAHEAAGAKLVEFAGWQMPLQFSKVKLEHLATRQAAGLFDISHMGLLHLSVKAGHGTGFEANQQTVLAALDGLVGQNLQKLHPGKAVYTHLLNAQGGIIDDIIIYALPDGTHLDALHEVLLICNASRREAVLDWLAQQLPQRQATVQWRHVNDTLSLLALQGPRFTEVLTAVGLHDTGRLPKRFYCAPLQLGDIEVLATRTGYTGEDGVELLVRHQDVLPLWQALIEQGAPLGLLPVGLAARDSLRTEAAYPLYGAELNEHLTPLEAGLGWSVKLDKPEPFIGQEALQAQKTNGLARHLTCLEMTAKAIPRPHDAIEDEAGRSLGEVTSGCFSPSLDKPIAMGYINGPASLALGTTVAVVCRGKAQPARVVQRPFYGGPS